jgi:uncharacterized protein (TIGR03435 family)
MRRIVLYGAIVAVSSLVAAQGQKSPTEPRPTFEIASIKRNRSGTSGGRFGEEPGGRWSMVNTAVISLIRSAYPTRELVNVPRWVESEPYDVNAKAEGNPTREQITLMLQALLADRFKLAVHGETRERPVFALVVARNDGRLGPGLLPSKVDCEAVNVARRAGRRPEGPLPSNGAPPCGWSSNGETLRVGGLPMSRVAGVFGKPDGRVVIDKTGLTGNYEFSIRYTTEPSSTDDRPSLFTALEEQLGLKLVSDRALLQELVVDHIERPTED